MNIRILHIGSIPISATYPRPRVFRKAYGRVRHVADSEDIVAMVFLEAWRNRRRVRVVDGSILPWLLTVITYVSLNLECSNRRYERLLTALPRPEDPRSRRRHR